MSKAKERTNTRHGHRHTSIRSKMSKEYERRTWDDVKLFYLNKIDELTLENIKLKAHAVEVLAKTLCESGGQWSFQHFEPDSGFRLKYINEARALLGWEE